MSDLSEYPTVTAEQICGSVEWLAKHAHGIGIGDWCLHSNILLGAAKTIQDLHRYVREMRLHGEGAEVRP